MNRDKIKEYLKMLDNTEIRYYGELEVAIMLFLRSDLDNFDKITDKQISDIFDIINNNDSLLDIYKEDIDSILESESE